MSVIQRLALTLAFGLVVVGCATNTSPTHVTVNATGDRPERATSQEAADTGEESDLFSVLERLHDELIALRRQVAALDSTEPPESTVEAPDERVARLECEAGQGVAPAMFAAPVAGDEIHIPGRIPVRIAGDERGILEQSLAAHKTANG